MPNEDTQEVPQAEAKKPQAKRTSGAKAMGGYIKLSARYRGVPSNEQIIPAGTYAAGDERLYGLARYLVENGHAVHVNDVGEPIA